MTADELFKKFCDEALGQEVDVVFFAALSLAAASMIKIHHGDKNAALEEITEFSQELVKDYADSYRAFVSK